MERGIYRLLTALICAGCIGCLKSVDETGKPFPKTIIGKWVLTDTQSAGIDPPGVWATAVPSGRWMDILDNGNISGTMFSSAAGYLVVDSVTVKILDPSQAAGFRLFNFQVDTVSRALFLYKRPANGGFCYEGCGAYKFIR